jgi:hypothetical protein
VVQFIRYGEDNRMLGIRRTGVGVKLRTVKAERGQVRFAACDRQLVGTTMSRCGREPLDGQGCAGFVARPDASRESR